MYSCQKTYTDIPFAHRQHRHPGHCSQIHGHNWSITFTFTCKELDRCGFVVDFGMLRPVKQWIDENLDHACVFNRGDPLLDEILAINDSCAERVFKPYVVEQCSCEGMAKHLFNVVSEMICEISSGRASIAEVEVIEDSRNRASYRPHER